MNRNDQEFLVEKIRTQYTQEKLQENADLEALKELHDQVRLPANVFGFTFGGVGTLLMGTGMSLSMTELGQVLGYEDPMFLGVALGLVGIAMMIANYPIYNSILTSRQKKYASQIIALSDKLMQ